MALLTTWIPAAASFVLTVVAIIALRPVAYAVDLLDRPGGHKKHQGAVPVVGGVGMLLGVVFGLSAYGNALGPLQHYFFSAVLLVVVGALDDRFNLPPGLRLLVQALAVLPMYFGAGVRITSLGDLFGSGPVDVSAFSLLTTEIVALAAINAFNMLDGLDGLASGIALIAILLVMPALLADQSGSPVSLLGSVLGASIAGFLVFNLPTRWNRSIRCFMGDAGSTLLGFSVAWLLIASSQGPTRVASPVTMIWLIAVPATDLVWTVVRRLSRGHSPTRPDNEHLHHLLLRAKLHAPAVFVVMAASAAVCGLVGYSLYRAGVSDSLSTCLLVTAGVLLVYGARYHAHALTRWFPDRRRDPTRIVAEHGSAHEH